MRMHHVHIHYTTWAEWKSPTVGLASRRRRAIGCRVGTPGEAILPVVTALLLVIALSAQVGEEGECTRWQGIFFLLP